eukprot:jgi/Picsp_1/2825/NSC_01051-R1_atp-binding cassette subfamily member 10
MQHSSLGVPLLHRSDSGGDDIGERDIGRNECDSDQCMKGGYSLSGLLRSLTFQNIAQLILKGFKDGRLELEDLPQLPECLVPKLCFLKFNSIRCEGAQSKGLSMIGQSNYLVKVMLLFLKRRFIALGFLRIATDLLNLFGPFGLSKMLENANDDVRHAYKWSSLLIGSMILKSFCDAHYTYQKSMLSLALRSALQTTLFREQLEIKGYQSKVYHAGRLQTLMAVDCERASSFCLSFLDLFSLVFQLIAALIMLYFHVKWTFVVGFSLVLLIIPLNQAVANRIRKASIEIMSAKDHRISLISEVLDAIRLIKANRWEGIFMKKIFTIRGNEVKHLRAIKYLDAVCVFLWATTSLLLSAATFGVYVLAGFTLQAQNVFPSLALFNILLGPLNGLPWVINGMVESYVSAKRLQCCMHHASENLDKAAVLQLSPHESIAIQNAEFQLDRNSGNLLIEDLRVTSSPCLITVISKGSGSGKTLFLLALLGELTCLSGQSVVEYERVAYVPRNSYLMPGTIKQNILFGSSYEKERYDQVVHACGLDHDLKKINKGDDCVIQIGSEVCLSGGQAARICLARALYSPNSKLILIDDILSSLDATLANFVAKNAIIGEVARGKTVLIATNLACLISNSHTVVSIDNKIARVISQKEAHQDQLCFTRSEDDMITLTNSDVENEGDQVASVDQLEYRNTGSVSWDTYKSYLYSGKILFFIIIISLFLMQASRNFSDIWLSRWANDSSNGQDSIFFLSIYMAIVAFCTVTCGIRSFAFAAFGIGACVALHDELMESVMQWPFKFFLSIPESIVLNRTTSDLACIDESLPFILNIFLAQIFGLMGVFAVLILSQQDNGIIVAIGLLGVLFWYRSVQKIYLASSRELRRLESIMKSPIYSHFASAFKGKIVVRAFNAKEMFTLQLHQDLKTCQQASNACALCSSWLALRLQLMSAFIACMVLLSSLLPVLTSDHNQDHNINSGLLGLSLSYVLPLTGLLSGFVSSGAELEMEMVAVERVRDFIAPLQAVEIDYETKPPNKGDIIFEQVWMRYRVADEWALRNISVQIPYGSRFALCGRSGSGKSSFLSCLLGIMPISCGNILFGEQPLHRISPDILRQILGFLPQSPVTFSCSIRENVDPASDFTDSDIKSALIKVSLWTTLCQGLSNESDVLDRNLSDGILLSPVEGHLLGIARIILRKPTYICLDEPSSNMSEDDIVRLFALIDEELRDGIVVETVHRLSRAKTADAVGIMEDGELVEADNPQLLWSDTESRFRRMLDLEQG